MSWPKLLALSKIVQPAEYIITSDTCTIGRSGECQIVVPIKSISRLHAKIERKGSHYILYDTNSTNGTFVNDRRIQKAHLLNHYDLIGLSAATAVLRFENPDSMMGFDSDSLTFETRSG